MKKTKLGQELISSLTEAVEYERGKKTLRTTTVEIPEPAKYWRKEQIARLRKEVFGVSQPVFASLLSVTSSTVKAWEQGLKTPSGAASRLLEVAEIDPNLFKKLAREKRSA
jgi:putative transcriptional regulator